MGVSKSEGNLATTDLGVRMFYEHDQWEFFQFYPGFQNMGAGMPPIIIFLVQFHLYFKVVFRQLFLLFVRGPLGKLGMPSITLYKLDWACCTTSGAAG